MKEKQDRSKWLDRVIRYGPLVFWIAVILFFSTSSAGSGAVTSRFIRPILEWLFPLASPDTIALYHAYLRKAGHFTGYAVLGLFSFRAFVPNGWGRSKLFVVSLGTCLVVALADEFIQSFSPARTATLYDVALDMSGTVTSVVIVLWARRQTGNG